MKFYFLLIFFIISTLKLSANDVQGHYLFLIHQGKDLEAWEEYLSNYRSTQIHDFELLKKMALSLMDQGFREKDPESQVLAVFGASFSANEEVLYILEEGMKNKIPEIQLVALHGLSKNQSERADQAMLKALSSPHLLLRYEALVLLCKKKHPQAVSQTESLMCKTPKGAMEIYPPLLAMTGDHRSAHILRKLLQNTSTTTRLAVILNGAKYKRDDLLPQIRQVIIQGHYKEQEAAAYALGKLKDESSSSKLKILANSHYSSVALAAHLALYRLGDAKHIQEIENMASQGDLEAISILGKIPGHSEILLKLVKEKKPQIRFNALIALIQQNQIQSLDNLSTLFLDGKEEWGFIPQYSPGRSIKYWKAVTGSKSLFKEDPGLLKEHLALKEQLIEKIRRFSNQDFLKIAKQIFQTQQNDLIPVTAFLLEDLGTPEAIKCLKEHQQQLGAPLVRNYCQLALYRLKEKGPWNENLKEWVKNKSKTDLIKLRPLSSTKVGKTNEGLSPEETTAFFIQALEAIAQNRNNEGIEVLIETIAFGHEKNKYALAGILLRAIE